MKIKYLIGEALYVLAGCMSSIGKQAARVAHGAAILQADHMKARRA